MDEKMVGAENYARCKMPTESWLVAVKIEEFTEKSML